MRPGLDVMQSFGGLHGFEKRDKPILTDSGGFQVEPGRHAQDHRRRRTLPARSTATSCSCRPEVSMQIQTTLNSDIVMQLDECTRTQRPRGHLTTEAEARNPWR